MQRDLHGLVDELRAQIAQLRGEKADLEFRLEQVNLDREEAVAYACEDAVASYLKSTFEVHGPFEATPLAVPEAWLDSPICRIKYAEDAGDSSVGIQGWGGFCLAEDQTGTILGSVLAVRAQSLAQMEDST